MLPRPVGQDHVTAIGAQAICQSSAQSRGVDRARVPEDVRRRYEDDGGG
jgi:hypothetical protein